MQHCELVLYNKALWLGVPGHIKGWPDHTGCSCITGGAEGFMFYRLRLIAWNWILSGSAAGRSLVSLPALDVDPNIHNGYRVDRSEAGRAQTPGFQAAQQTPK